MVKKKSWKEFRNCGFLFMINQLLHFFGWAIVFEFDGSGDIKEVYPARVKYRGFDDQAQDVGYKKVTDYMAENAESLQEDV